MDHYYRPESLSADACARIHQSGHPVVAVSGSTTSNDGRVSTSAIAIESMSATVIESMSASKTEIANETSYCEETVSKTVIVTNYCEENWNKTDHGGVIWSRNEIVNVSNPSKSEIGPYRGNPYGYGLHRPV